MARPVAANRYIHEYTPNTGKVKKVGERPREEWILLKIPPMILPARWKKVQRIIDANRNTGRPSTDDHLLKGLLVCGDCGATLYLQGGGGQRRRYYSCHNRVSAKHQRSTKNRERCQLPYLPTDKLDRLVFSYVCHILSDPDFILDRLLSEEARQKNLKGLEAKAQALCDSRHASSGTHAWPAWSRPVLGAAIRKGQSRTPTP